VPDPEAIDRAVELIRQAYEEDFQRVGDMPEPLIQKLLVAAAQTEEVARKYAALLEAQQVAVTGGDFGRAIELVDIRATEFDIDAAQGRLDLLAKLLTPKAKTDPDLLSTLYVHCMETAETAISAGNATAARAAADMAVGIGRSLQLLGRARKLPDLVSDGEDKLREAQDLVKTIQKRAAAIKQVEEARRMLATTPDDPQANACVGRYLCFVADDWQAGLQLLAKGPTSEAREIAVSEIGLPKAVRLDTQQVFVLAGRWWKLSESDDVSRDEAIVIKKHAGAIYGVIVERLQDPLESQLARTRTTKSGATEQDVRSMEQTLRGPSTDAPRPAPRGTDLRSTTTQDAVGDSRAVAIERGLVWLREHQMPDGGWSFDHGQSRSCNGRCTHPG
jgi:hypothetical protein